MLTFDNATAVGIVEENLGPEGKSELSKFGSNFQAFPELEKAVESDVKLLQTSSLVAKGTTISGWVVSDLNFYRLYEEQLLTVVCSMRLRLER
jgi:hypothetical protein